MEAIEDYGRREHGLEQADRYGDALLDDMAMLLEFPGLGTAAGKRGLRRKPCGVHVIFYTVEAEVLTIVRILHRRMEPSRHL